MTTVAWTCPFCNRDTTIVDTNINSGGFFLNIENANGPRYLYSHVIVCPNPKCRQFTLTANMLEAKRPFPGAALEPGNLLKTWQLIPQSNARVFPDYIPESIRLDYEEACLIRELSPKASATLSRRCLQGMIRDFFGISKSRLVDEIVAIKEKVDELTWQAIDATRNIGNIGAHMEKDINVIVDVDQGEAEKLVQLIEILMKDWYIARQERQARLEAVLAVDAAKKAAKKGNGK